MNGIQGNVCRRYCELRHLGHFPTTEVDELTQRQVTLFVDRLTQALNGISWLMRVCHAKFYGVLSQHIP
ncbi:hypothetical protein T265_15839 [Opisthorchis viverrini]|uniref:Uncharacterized protein n=1 Tax=Opisthorchis viverrini TaxID=6198 RepID=A0A074ZU89_OPIVI|nr:hypothetical protein T265_15839 [Opisthorchis viverrini]KER18764.1 hypothetical protein T265_15839 [Opisthorchis viverrini]